MRQLVRNVPKWVLPRLVLALVLMGVALLGVLFIPPLLGGEKETGSPAGTLVVEAPAGNCPSSISDAAIRCEINAIRRAAGLRAIRPTRPVKVAAQRHSDDMVRRRYFAHVSPSGATLRERVRRAGYLRGARSPKLGENIAWGSGSSASPAAIVGAWMQSPGHRAIILTRDFREAGVGITGRAPQGGDGATYVLDVGKRR